MFQWIMNRPSKGVKMMIGISACLYVRLNGRVLPPSHCVAVKAVDGEQPERFRMPRGNRMVPWREREMAEQPDQFLVLCCSK
jgi:hypothetical protein